MIVPVRTERMTSPTSRKLKFLQPDIQDQMNIGLERASNADFRSIFKPDGTMVLDEEPTEILSESSARVLMRAKMLVIDYDHRLDGRCGLTTIRNPTLLIRANRLVRNYQRGKEFYIVNPLLH
jgi:hypothetical protein